MFVGHTAERRHPEGAIDYPTRDPEVHEFELDNELIVFDERNTEAHVLNETGALLWGQCDGAHNANELSMALIQKYQLTYAQAQSDVAEFINKLHSAGLLAARPS